MSATNSAAEPGQAVSPASPKSPPTFCRVRTILGLESGQDKESAAPVTEKKLAEPLQYKMQISDPHQSVK